MTVPRHPPFHGTVVGRLRRWCWLHVRRHKGELCQDCGTAYPLVWWADSELFELACGYDTGLICPKCFDRRLRKLGVLVVWQPHARGSIEEWGFDIERSIARWRRSPEYEQEAAGA